MKYYILKMVEFDSDEELTKAQVDKLVNEDIDKLPIEEIESEYGLDFKYGVCCLQNENAETQANELFEAARAFGQL